MKNDKFDRMLSEIRSEQVDDQVVAQAGQRIWKSITAAASTSPLNHTLRSCEDFQALIPEYLGKQLAPARAFLFEDHVHACVACRHALDRKRDGERQPVWRVEPWNTTPQTVLGKVGFFTRFITTWATAAWPRGVSPRASK
jgi:hypothetical protein